MTKYWLQDVGGGLDGVAPPAHCLNQLCLEYETKLFIAMSVSPGRNTTTISGQSRGRPKKIVTKHSSALYMGMTKVLPIIDVLGYDGQNSLNLGLVWLKTMLKLLSPTMHTIFWVKLWLELIHIRGGQKI